MTLGVGLGSLLILFSYGKKEEEEERILLLLCK